MNTSSSKNPPIWDNDSSSADAIDRFKGVTTNEMFQDLAVRVRNLGRYAASLDAMDGDTERLFNEWRLFHVENMELMLQVHNHSISHQVDPITKQPIRVRVMRGISVFIELTRLWLLVGTASYEPLGQRYLDSITLESMHDPIWVMIYISFKWVKVDADSKDDPDIKVVANYEQLQKMWSKPILAYTQSQVIVCVLFLTQMLNELSLAALPEFKQVYELLWLRMGALLVRYYKGNDVLDVPKMCDATDVEKGVRFNARFLTFCTNYMTHPMKRLLYYDLFDKKRMKLMVSPASVTTLTAWVDHIMNQFLVEEAFTEAYTKHCEDAYWYPGDDIWFRFRYPLEVPTVATSLGKMRPHLRDRFHSEGRTTKQLVFSNVHSNHIARTFMLHVISMYMRVRAPADCELDWYRGVVIDADDTTDIEKHDAVRKLCGATAPLMFQPISRHMVYFNGEMYMTDNIYESIAAWFQVLKKKFAGVLLDRNMNFFIKEIETFAAPSAANAAGVNGQRKRPSILL